MTISTSTTMTTTMATFEDLEKAACCLLQIIKDTPELGKTTKVAIAGGMAIRKYLPKQRLDNAGQSIDLIINSTTSASLIRKKLLQHPMSPLVEANQLLYYQQTSPVTTPTGSMRSSTSSSTASSSSSQQQQQQQQSLGIEIRITPEMLCPYLPSAAKLVHDLAPSPATLPYVSLVDLIVFKLDACGLRDSTQSKEHEVRDAAALLELATEHSALDLSADQARVVEESLPDVLRHSPADRQKAWWQTRLIGLCDPDARKAPSQVLSDLIENMALDDSSARRPGSGLAGGRTPSSSSKTSLSSMTSSSSSSSGSGSGSGSGGNFVTSSSPVTASGPGLPGSDHGRNHQDLTCAIPRRPRKFSTSQHSPIKGTHSRKKSVDQGKPKRHSQVLGSLPSGSIAHNTSPCGSDGSPSSPGLTLTARFESTPGENNLVNSSYF